MRIELIKHNDCYYWLIEFGRGVAVEGYSKTLEGAMKEIMNEAKSSG